MFAELFGADTDEGETINSKAGPNLKFGALIQKPPENRASCGFVGLENQGATCYLNSLIQALYMTPELRNGLFAINPLKQLNAQYLDEFEDEISSKAKSGEVTAEEDSLARMIDMGMDEHGSRKSLVATNNRGIEDAVEYYTSHENDPGFKVPPAGEKDKKKKRKPRVIPLELQRLFTNMQVLQKQALSTEDLTTKGFQWQGMDGRVQHDAHELNRLLIDALERSLKGTSGESLCQRLYQGELRNQTKCLSCNIASGRQECYYDILLQVVGLSDMAASLRSYTVAELMVDLLYQLLIANSALTLN